MADEILFYGRQKKVAVEQQRKLILPDELEHHRATINNFLSMIDSKPCISSTFTNRMLHHLVHELDLPIALAKDSIAKRFGYVNWKQLYGSRNTEHYHTTRAKTTPSIVMQMRGDMRSEPAKRRDNQKLEQKQRQLLQRLMNGTNSTPARSHPKTYFYFKHPHYVKTLEELIQSYSDCYLEDAIGKYPYDRLTWSDHDASFGLFWKEVVKLHSSGKADFSAPGLKAIKNLAHHLFAWHFRRYMESEIIFRYARFVPTEYRRFHIAIKRDTFDNTVVDEDYVELEFDEGERDA